ncbi:hypothetical protein BGW36DRAFT_367049 [Talaromyces proteolyticus]|uniref:Uncharacterized protein n=1 Tax=Talaromyces proteolyticus TaxID=1131652 RepID=A0AAD4Q136_9EURO|nr:uncharacterized protein BGW36DRAFT_367049 [Talaromyces proteolyticus]KAH8705190.1 hypothetical protein BGW36DRAFT_367049 [Talaromyces proteolyticus]
MKNPSIGLRAWHEWLSLSRQTPESWHQYRLMEEQQECHDADTLLLKLSETSDVLFSISRARYDGYDIANLPFIFSYQYFLPYCYMLAKFSSRCMFYKTAATLCDAPNAGTVREVVNPAKDEKLDQVAVRHQINPTRFKHVSRQLRRV